MPQQALIKECFAVLFGFGVQRLGFSHGLYNVPFGFGNVCGTLVKKVRRKLRNQNGIYIYIYLFIYLSWFTCICIYIYIFVYVSIYLEGTDNGHNLRGTIFDTLMLHGGSCPGIV